MGSVGIDWAQGRRGGGRGPLGLAAGPNLAPETLLQAMDVVEEAAFLAALPGAADICNEARGARASNVGMGLYYAVVGRYLRGK